MANDIYFKEENVKKLEERLKLYIEVIFYLIYFKLFKRLKNPSSKERWIF